MNTTIGIVVVVVFVLIIWYRNRKSEVPSAPPPNRHFPVSDDKLHSGSNTE